MTITTKKLTSLTATTFFAVLLSLSFGNQDAYAQSFPDFSDLTGLQLNGNAAQSGNDLRVTPSVGGQAGAAFFDTTVGIETFSTQFEFVFSNPGGAANGFTGEVGADGIVFAIQNDANMEFAVGGGGGSLGYAGISPSVGVSFDTWANNWGAGPEDEENISILQNGDVVNVLNTIDFDFTYGQNYNAWIDYDGTTLDVYIDTTNVKPGAPILSQAIDIPVVLGASDGYVGFTSGTGAAFADHDILNWNFDSLQVEKIYTHTNNDWNLVCEISLGVPGVVIDDVCYDVADPETRVDISFRQANINTENVFALPLPDTNGTFELLGDQKGNKKTVVNPGQYIQATSITVPVQQSVWMTEDVSSCDNIGSINPNKVPGGVQVVRIDSTNGDVIDIDDDLALEIGGSLTLIGSIVEVHVDDVPAGDTIRVMVKFQPLNALGIVGNECTLTSEVLDVDGNVIDSASADLIIIPK